MSDDGCAAAAAAAEEGAPSETAALLPLTSARLLASSVVVRSRKAPLSSDGAGVWAARVTNACTHPYRLSRSSDGGCETAEKAAIMRVMWRGKHPSNVGTRSEPSWRMRAQKRSQ